MPGSALRRPKRASQNHGHFLLVRNAISGHNMASSRNSYGILIETNDLPHRYHDTDLYGNSIGIIRGIPSPTPLSTSKMKSWVWIRGLGWVIPPAGTVTSLEKQELIVIGP